MAFGNYGNQKSEVSYEVIKNYGKLSDTGRDKELRIVKWNNGAEKYDIRPWSKDKDGNEKAEKGITLSSEEIAALYELLKQIAEE